MFEPSIYSDDAATATSTTASSGGVFDQLTSFLTSAAPALSVASELIGKSDGEKVAILRAKIKNYKILRNKAPYSVVPGTAWYNAEIRKMTAQADALSKIAADEADTTRDYSIMRKLTSAGGLVGVGVGCAVIYFIVKKARK